MFFSPVLHSIPDDLPYVIVRFIIHKFKRKIVLRYSAKNAISIASPFWTE
jgi:hypothetical protein